MQCPVCKNYELSHIIKIGDLVIHSCSNCRGFWFKNDELKRAKDIKLPDANWFDFDLYKDKSKFSGGPGKRICSNCGINLYQLYYGDSKIQIDVCAKCFGVWLDYREFEKIIKYVREKSDYEILHHYFKNLLLEAEEIFTGPEGLRSEIADFLMLAKMFQYKFAAQHQNWSTFLEFLPK